MPVSRVDSVFQFIQRCSEVRKRTAFGLKGIDRGDFDDSPAPGHLADVGWVQDGDYRSAMPTTLHDSLVRQE